MHSAKSKSHETATSIGGTHQLLRTYNPSLRSQPNGANFSMHTQLPPPLAARMTGSGMKGMGLYAGAHGRGLYM